MPSAFLKNYMTKLASVVESISVKAFERFIAEVDDAD